MNLIFSKKNLYISDRKFYNIPRDPAVKPTTNKKENSNKSLGNELTNKLN